MLMHPRASAGVIPCCLQLLGLCPCRLMHAPRRGSRRKAGYRSSRAAVGGGRSVLPGARVARAESPPRRRWWSPGGVCSWLEAGDRLWCGRLLHFEASFCLVEFFRQLEPCMLRKGDWVWGPRIPPYSRLRSDGWVVRSAFWGSRLGAGWPSRSGDPVDLGGISLPGGIRCTVMSLC